MSNNSAFKAALAISVSIHLFAISAGDIFTGRVPDDTKNEVEVTYMLEKLSGETTQNMAQSAPRKYDLERRRPQWKKEPRSPKRRLPVPIRQPIQRDFYAIKKPEHIDAEHMEDYISYYQLIREDIRKHVNRYYGTSSEEGVVYLIFRLLRNGTLKKASVDTIKSVKSPLLRKIAIRSVNSASPFPPFPKALAKKELTFIVPIIFRRE